MACVVCNEVKATIQESARLSPRDVSCPLCGRYRINHLVIEDRIIDKIPLDDRKLFSAYIRNHSLEEDPITLSGEDIVRIPETIAQYKKFTAMDKANNVICFLAENSSIGTEASLCLETDYPKFYCKSVKELRHIRDYLDKTGIIKMSSQQSGPVLTIDGWQKYESLKKINQNSKRVFVAMSFDQALNPLFEEAIKPACEACDLVAFRVDLEEHNEKICDKIIADIKSSRFVIADFTMQKHNVYYEAGFAKGLGLAVIWCCKEDEKDSLKFDIRQYNHILWSDYEDLKNRLINRILAQ